MYQALLTRKYLTSKVVPFLGILAVALCSLMLLVTWSIMGGFLVMLLAIGRDMEGDVSISWPTVGFAHYEDLIDRLHKDPMVAAACPMIETFGIVTLPDGRRGGSGGGVQIKGVDARYANVTNYANALWWRPIEEPLPKDKERKDLRLDPNGKGELERLYEDGLRFQEFDREKQRLVPAVVLGIELADFSQRQLEGYYRPAGSVGMRTGQGFEWIPGFIPHMGVTVTVLPLTEKTRDIGVEQRFLPVANEFRTGLFEADKSSALMDLGELQRMLKMDEWQRLGATGGSSASGGSAGKKNPYEIELDAHGREIVPGSADARPVIGIEPARVTTVLVKAAEGVSPERLRERCIEIYAAFAAAHAADAGASGTSAPPSPAEMERSRTIQTFEMSRATFIGAVKQETVVVLMLLIVLSIVGATLILAIFWAMVSEKTRDIGTLRAVGASRAGIAWIWLRYGLVIGAVGAALGLAGAALLVWNINPIHEWMGHALNISVWDPKVYYFSKIPNEINPMHALIVSGGALVFSLLGALIPALRAARMDPVKALRFE